MDEEEAAVVEDAVEEDVAKVGTEPGAVRRTGNPKQLISKKQKKEQKNMYRDVYMLVAMWMESKQTNSEQEGRSHL